MAFVEYGTHEEAAEARAACHETELDESALNVDWVIEKKGIVSGQMGVTNTVFCGNLDPSTQQSTIKWFFE